MELESMIEEMQREDILQVYVFKQGPRVFTAGRASCTRSRTSDVLFLFFFLIFRYIGKQKLQREAQEEILKQADEELKNMKPLTPPDVIKMFQNCPINDKGDYRYNILF